MCRSLVGGRDLKTQDTWAITYPVPPSSHHKADMICSEVWGCFAVPDLPKSKATAALYLWGVQYRVGDD